MRVGERRRLGGSPVEVTALSFGGAAIGGLYTQVPDGDAAAAVARALATGMGYFDTAPHYGAGRSERRLGPLLRSSGAVISTKAGRLLRPLEPGEGPDDEGFVDEPPFTRVWDFSADGVRRSLAESLDRLGLDRVDILYIHDPDRHEEQVYAETYPALARLRDEGVVGAIGAGMNQAAMLTRFVRRLDLDVVLCAGRYTLLDRAAGDELLPACLERGTSVVIGGVYNSGLLAGGGTFEYAPASPGIRAEVARLREACDAYGVPLKAAALQFPARHPAVASVLVGCRTAAEVDENAAMFETGIPDALWPELDRGEA
ncbi:aldo/keto reductase [Actinomadura vinacea]|uniref:Aldo/keto reductase n=1 Tax=Actinomadura vinacea TaxID=115336 RepID=A0ABN3IG70_9ACTN